MIFMSQVENYTWDASRISLKVGERAAALVLDP
jgi:hypothetical protein